MLVGTILTFIITMLLGPLVDFVFNSSVTLIQDFTSLSNGIESFDNVFTTFSTLHVMDLMKAVGMGVLFLVFLFSIYRSMWGKLTNSEEPVQLVAKTGLAAFLIVWSDKIFLDIVFPLTSSFVTTVSGVFAASQPSFDDEFSLFGTFKAAVVAIASQLSGMVILFPAIILALILTWKFLQLLLEVVERYVVLCILYYTSPLAFAAVASKSTQDVFASWCRMLFSQCLMMVMNIFFLRGFVGGLSSFVHNVTVGHMGLGSFVAGYFLLLTYLRVASHFDELLAQVGMNAAKTGSGPLGEFMAGFAAIRPITRMMGGFVGGGGGRAAVGGVGAGGRGTAGAVFGSGLLGKVAGNVNPNKARAGALGITAPQRGIYNRWKGAAQAMTSGTGVKSAQSAQRKMQSFANRGTGLTRFAQNHSGTMVGGAAQKLANSRFGQAYQSLGQRYGQWAAKNFNAKQAAATGVAAAFVASTAKSGAAMVGKNADNAAATLLGGVVGKGSNGAFVMNPNKTKISNGRIDSSVTGVGLGAVGKDGKATNAALTMTARPYSAGTKFNAGEEKIVNGPGGAFLVSMRNADGSVNQTAMRAIGAQTGTVVGPQGQTVGGGPSNGSTLVDTNGKNPYVGGLVRRADGEMVAAVNGGGLANAYPVTYDKDSGKYELTDGAAMQLKANASAEGSGFNTQFAAANLTNTTDDGPGNILGHGVDASSIVTDKNGNSYYVPEIDPMVAGAAASLGYDAAGSGDFKFNADGNLGIRDADGNYNFFDKSGFCTSTEIMGADGKQEALVLNDNNGAFFTQSTYKMNPETGEFNALDSTFTKDLGTGNYTISGADGRVQWSVDSQSGIATQYDADGNGWTKYDAETGNQVGGHFRNLDNGNISESLEYSGDASVNGLKSSVFERDAAGNVVNETRSYADGSTFSYGQDGTLNYAEANGVIMRPATERDPDTGKMVNTGEYEYFAADGSVLDRENAIRTMSEAADAHPVTDIESYSQSVSRAETPAAPVEVTTQPLSETHNDSYDNSYTQNVNEGDNHYDSSEDAQGERTSWRDILFGDNRYVETSRSGMANAYDDGVAQAAQAAQVDEAGRTSVPPQGGSRKSESDIGDGAE